MTTNENALKRRFASRERLLELDTPFLYEMHLADEIDGDEKPESIPSAPRIESPFELVFKEEHAPTAKEASDEFFGRETVAEAEKAAEVFDHLEEEGEEPEDGEEVLPEVDDEETEFEDFVEPEAELFDEVAENEFGEEIENGHLFSGIGAEAEIHELRIKHREVAVGERIILDLKKTVFASYEVVNVRWTVPGKTIRYYFGDRHKSQLIELGKSDFKQARLIFHWVDAGDGREVRARITWRYMGVQRESDLIFPFDVKGPTLDHFLATTDRPRIVRERRLWGIRLGKLRGAPGIDWDWQVTMPAKHDGWIKDLQTTKVRREKIQLMRKGGRATRKMTWKHPKKERHEQLDQAFSDKGTEATYSASGYYPPIEFPAKVEAVKTFRNDATFDSPTTLLQPLDISATVHDSFKYFVLYKPDKKGAIWVPVAKAEWFWKAKASKRGSRWRLTHKDAGVSAKGAPTFEFPIYESNVNENQWVEVDGGKLDEEIEEQDSSPDSCPEEQEEGRLMDLTGSWNTTVSGVVGKTTREVGMPSGQHFPKGALDEAERKHESPFLDEELFADADVGFAERHVLGLAVDRPASPYPFAVELLEPEAGIETDVRSTEYKRGQALTCEPGRFKENQLQVVCWRRRTTPGKRRIPEKLKLAILCRGRIRLPTQKLQWLLESYKNAGWVSRLKVDLLQQLPWVDVTIELFFNQRVGRVTTEKINAVFKEYLQRRQERHFKGCPFVLYDASPAVRKGSYERKLGVQFERFYRLAGVPLPQKMDERDQQRYWLLVYASFPREIKKLIGPEKKADVERPLAVRKSIKQWRKEADELFINYKRQVPGRLTVADAKELNRRITASYAKMYLSRPAIFKWAGMAAFASAEIGRGIQKAWQLGFGDWGLSATGTALVWVGGLAKTGESVGPILGKKLFWALSGGNRFVWWDIFWQHLAYREAGIAALKFVHDAGELSQPPLDAWQHIDTGLQKGDSAIIWKGSRELLKYEQEFVLQAQVYDRSRDIWSKISDDVPSPIPEHGVKFTDYVQGGDIGNFENRWKWIEESMLPSWMSIETNKPEKVRSLLLALT